jgi:hypothetical protein
MSDKGKPPVTSQPAVPVTVVQSLHSGALELAVSLGKMLDAYSTGLGELHNLQDRINQESENLRNHSNYLEEVCGANVPLGVQTVLNKARGMESLPPRESRKTILPPWDGSIKPLAPNRESKTIDG